MLISEKYIFKLQYPALSRINTNRYLMEINNDLLQIVVKMGRAISELPKVSVVYASDEMFRNYVFSFNKEENDAIKSFFNVYTEYGLMTDDLKIKLNIFNEVMADREIREYYETNRLSPNRLTKLKRPAELLKYSSKELARIFRKFSFINYLDKRKPKKTSEDDFFYMFSKLNKEDVDVYNRIINLDI